VRARPFLKFFNLLEHDSTQYQNLPKCSFTVTEKMDGSLLIGFWHRGEYHTSTKGSLSSDQAKWGLEWLKEHVDLSKVRKGWTHLYEIIYPGNKIVIDYGDFRGAVLLACVENATGAELPYEELRKEADLLKVPVVPQITGYTDLEALYQYCRGLPKEKEGFVVQFENGMRVKMKGDEYCKIHRLITHMTPLDFWRAWDLELRDIPKDYMTGIPEEFRELSDTIHGQIYAMHWDLFNKIGELCKELRSTFFGGDQKAFALNVKEKEPKMFNYIMHWDKNKIKQMSNRELGLSIASQQRLKRMRA
jgi:RNA ligase